MWSTDLASPGFITWLLVAIFLALGLVGMFTWIWSRRHSHFPDL